MEDFGEYTPPDVVSPTGHGLGGPQPLPARLPLRASARGARAARPLVRFQRSGWTGAARCADVVWGGDPTTVVALRRPALGAGRRALSIGLCGVGRWGSDIGGYNSFGPTTG